MARTIIFSLKGSSFEAVPNKVDRSKLYGTSEIIALDDSGKECNLASMDESGAVIFLSGSTSLGYMSSEDKWVERSELVALNEDDSKAVKEPSSYSAPVDLKDIVTPQEYLSYHIVSMYELQIVGGELLKSIGEDIYSFDYRYNDAYESQKAFLIASADSLFMLVGTPAQIEMYGLNETDDSAVEEDSIEVSNDLDFSF